MGQLLDGQITMKLLIATGNASKVKEFREMLGAEKFAWSDLSSHENLQTVEETGV